MVPPQFRQLTVGHTLSSSSRISLIHWVRWGRSRALLICGMHRGRGAGPSFAVALASWSLSYLNSLAWASSLSSEVAVRGRFGSELSPGCISCTSMALIGKQRQKNSLKWRCKQKFKRGTNGETVTRDNMQSMHVDKWTSMGTSGDTCRVSCECRHELNTCHQSR